MQPDNEPTPLYEGLGAEWNGVVESLPEDRRNEYADFIKNQLGTYEPLKQYEDLHKSGIKPDQAINAINLYKTIEANPKAVYDEIGKYLGITSQQAQQVVEQIEEGDPEEDPRYATLQQQVETMSQILLLQNQQNTQAQMAAEADAALDRELTALKNKYPDADEDQVIMYMHHSAKPMSAEEAYKAYTERDNIIRARRPAPMLLGGSGQIPNRGIDPTKLSPSDTKNVVTQMLQHAQQERNN